MPALNFLVICFLDRNKKTVYEIYQEVPNAPYKLIAREAHSEAFAYIHIKNIAKQAGYKSWNITFMGDNENA